MSEETTIKCFCYNQHFDQALGVTIPDDDFTAEIKFTHKCGIDDAHLAKEAWSFAYNEITQYDDEDMIDTTVLRRILLCGENGEFEVDAIHQYPMYTEV